MSCSQSAGQQLSVDDLPVVMEELNDTRAKWYNIGLQLRMSVGTLNAIKKDCNSTSDCLRETLTTWLKTCPSPPTWKNIVDALRSSTVGEVRLAVDLEQKYCSTQDTSVAATHHHALPSSPSQALTQTTPPTQHTIPPMQPPVLAYSGTPPSHPPPWSASYYYSPHTSYPLYTPFPLTPPTSGVATTSVHPSSQVPQVLPTSSRPLLSSVPAQPTTNPQFLTTLPQYPSLPSLTTIPPGTFPIPPPATPPALSPLTVTARTSGKKADQYILFHLKSILLYGYIATCTLILHGCDLVFKHGI